MSLRFVAFAFACSILLPIPSVWAQEDVMDAPKPSPTTLENLRVVVYPVRGTDLTDRQAELFGDQLVRELNKLEGTGAISWKDGLEQAVPPKGCETDSTCLAKIAKAFGAALVITARVNRVHASDIVTLKALDLEAANLEATATHSVGIDEGALSALGEAVNALFPQRALRSGATRGVKSAVSERWDPKPLPQPVFWSGVAATAGMLAGGIVYGLKTRDAERDFERLAELGQTQPVDGRLLAQKNDDAQRFARNANLFYALTGVVAASTVIAGIFTDWGSDDGIVSVSVGPEGAQAGYLWRW